VGEHPVGAANPERQRLDQDAALFGRRFGYVLNVETAAARAPES
jgi:hypothetical protein